MSKQYRGPDRRVKDDPDIPQWEERRGRSAVPPTSEQAQELQKVATDVLNYLSVWVEAPSERGLHPYGEKLVARLRHALKQDAETRSERLRTLDWLAQDARELGIYDK